VSVELDSDHGVYGSPGSLLPRDIRFRPDDTAHCSRLDETTLFFRVLAEPGLDDGLLVARVGSTVLGHELVRAHAGERFDVWEVSVADTGEAFLYSFAFKAPGGVPVYLAPSGITNAIERLDRWDLDPAAIPIHEVPDWAVGAVVYQIFPDRFAVGDTAARSGEVPAWGSAPNPSDRQGGDLIGVAERADYLADLGVDAVYLNPIFTSPSNHRYDTIDYLSVDPQLGGTEALDELVATLHERGIRVILDASFNHCHPRFFAFADVVRRGSSSPYAGWFDVFDHPARIRHRPGVVPVGGVERSTVARLGSIGDETGLVIEEVEGEGPAIEVTYDAWYGVPSMPRVHLAHPDARNYMLDVATHWVKRHDIDGWRMDVARYVDTDFWIDLRRVVKAVKPSCLLVAEIMGDSGRWLQGDRFDSVMNYTFRQLCTDHFALGAIDSGEFLDRYIRLLAMYSPLVTSVNFNLLSSHDTPRFLTIAGGDERRLLLAQLFQLTSPGLVSIYYGDEIGMTGGDDPENRGAFPLDAPDRESPLWVATRDLIRLRRDRSALRNGTWTLLHHSGQAFSYRRAAGDEVVSVALNASDAPASLPLGPAGRAELLWGAGEVRVGGGAAEVVGLPPMSGCVVAV
jgi:glycosidase